MKFGFSVFGLVWYFSGKVGLITGDLSVNNPIFSVLFRFLNVFTSSLDPDLFNLTSFGNKSWVKARVFLKSSYYP